MEFTRELQRLLAGLLITLVLVGIISTYWAVIGPTSILGRDDNARNFEARAAILRGEIVDRHGEILAYSFRPSGSRFAQREYFEPSMHSALGYYSLRYGTGGAEAAYNSILSGDDLPYDLSTYFNENLLHLPRRGSDIQLTFDLELQRHTAALLASHRGAVVILSVPDGAVLSMVSMPTFDPNTLDNDWETLITAEGDPFFNRALQGRYQPGGTMHTILSTAALIQGISLNTEYTQADQPVIITDLTLECASTPTSSTLTLAEAYRMGCPAPFAELTESLTTNELTRIFELFQLGTAPNLQGFIVDQPTPAPTAKVTEAPSPPRLLTLEDALGQGQITVSPMQMASIMAAIINAGNAPQPYVLMATRPPDSTIWTPISRSSQSIPITTTETARQIQALMRENVSSGNARAASRSDVNIGGQAALAYSGDETQAWFIGFARTGDRTGIAIAVVIENSSDLRHVSAVGGTLLERAVRRRATP